LIFCHSLIHEFLHKIFVADRREAHTEVHGGIGFGAIVDEVGHKVGVV